MVSTVGIVLSPINPNEAPDLGLVVVVVQADLDERIGKQTPRREHNLTCRGVVFPVSRGCDASWYVKTAKRQLHALT
jgi:hypothetical protein